MTKPLATTTGHTTIAAHQPALKMRARFRHSLRRVIGTRHTTTIASHQPPSSKTSHVCLFSRVVTSWHHYHHHHPRKRATYAHFRGWSLLGTTTTTTILENEHKQLVFKGGCSLVAFCYSPPPPPPYTLENELICLFSTVLLVFININ